MGQYDKGVDYYEKYLAICRELKDRQGAGQALMNLGQKKQYRCQLGEAEASFHHGLKIYESIKIPTSRPKNILGMIYLAKGDVAKAEPFIAREWAWFTKGEKREPANRL